jgi:iron-sulfur cluster repair protein YtfE (RIC family)
MPLIRDYIAEHERATDLGGEVVRALDRGEIGVAGELLRAMGTELDSHWDGEERGLFAVMGRDGLYAQHIRPLVREHRELARLIDTVDLGDRVDQQRVRVAVLELREHIAKEEDGLFPASLTSLTGEEWDASMQAWYQAHPGERMVGE